MPQMQVNHPRLSHLSPVHLVAFLDVALFALLSFVDGVFTQVPFVFGIGKAVLVYLVYYMVKQLRLGESYLTTIVAMLMTLSLVMQFRLSQAIGMRQFLWFLFGTGAFLATTALFPYVYQKIRSIWLLYGLLIFLFVVTLLFGVQINGAKNWLIIGGVSFQASEFIKIVFVCFMASFVANPEALTLKFKTYTLHSKWTLMVLIYVLLGFFVLQREFGTALVVFMVFLTTLYVFEKQMWYFIGNVGLASVGALIAFKIVPHLQVRIVSWLNPYADMAGKGYQITQSLFAIGTGGFFGTGIGLGHPEFIPNVRTDFIFSAICEELGIFGGMAVMLLFFLLVYRGIKISLQLRDPFTKSFAFGLSTLLGYQTFVIIGGVTKVIPLTGITLPFMSYGGSSLIASFIVLGLLQALSGPILREEVATLHDVNHQ